MSCDSLRKHITNVCLNSEYGNKGRLTKFTSDTIYWDFEDGSLHSYNDKIHINEIFDEISHYTKIKFKNQSSQTPFISIYIGSVDAFKEKCDISINGNVNGYAIWYARSDNIYKANVFVSDSLEGRKRKDVIREELTQALGMTGDVNYNNTIFYQYKSLNNEYHDKYFDIDIQTLKFLYGINSKPGMVKSDIEKMSCKQLSNEEEYYYKQNKYYLLYFLFIILLFLTLN